MKLSIKWPEGKRRINCEKADRILGDLRRCRRSYNRVRECSDLFSAGQRPDFHPQWLFPRWLPLAS